MKVAFFQFYPDTLWRPGGGEVQLTCTKSALERKGVRVDLYDLWSRAHDFDVMHVFGSTYELSSFVTTLASLGKPTVVTTIAYSSKPRWHWQLWSTIDRLIPVSTIYRLRQRIYQSADYLIAGSQAEAKQLGENFKFSQKKLRVVLQGIDSSSYQNAKPDLFKEKTGLSGFVLQVGRINHHKGQLRLIEAIDPLKIPLVFIGPIDAGDRKTSKKFLQYVEKRPWVHYLGALQANDPLLVSAYAAARVHALPSLMESLGLVTLEAGAAGASVVTGDYAPIREYLGERACYCDPQSITSIRHAITRAMNTSNAGLSEYIRQKFSWDGAADQLIAIYEEAIAHRKQPSI